MTDLSIVWTPHSPPPSLGTHTSQISFPHITRNTQNGAWAERMLIFRYFLTIHDLCLPAEVLLFFLGGGLGWRPRRCFLLTGGQGAQFRDDTKAKQLSLADPAMRKAPLADSPPRAFGLRPPFWFGFFFRLLPDLFLR